MKLDTANRTFLAVIAIATGAYVLAGIGACAVFSLVVYRVATDGFGVLTRGGVALQVGVLILALMGAGTIFGLRSVRSQLNSTERLMKSIRLRRISPSHEHLSAAVRARLGSRLYVVSAAEPFSFTFGLFFPKVVFSTGLASALSSAELDAVLTHERYHVRNFDPLKVLLARALGRAFFWLPLLRDLLRRCRSRH